MPHSAHAEPGLLLLALRKSKLIHICEADANVVGYYMQPHRLEMRVIGFDAPLIYFPDAVRLMADGRVQIVEAKAFPSDDPDYLHKLALAEQVYNERGWTFHVETNQTHFDNGTYKHAKWITDDRDVRLDTCDWLNLLRHMEGCGGLSNYGSVIRALARDTEEPAFLGRARAHKMIIRRAIQVGLDRRPRDDSPVAFLGADAPALTFDLQRAWLERSARAREVQPLFLEAA
jgi:hypothetical protein